MTALLPANISFTDGAVIPLALSSAICALCATESAEIAPGVLPGVKSPALGLPYPTVDGAKPGSDKTIVVYGGSSSVGSMTTQVAAAAGIHVIAVAGKANFEFSKRCGAAEVFDYKDPSFVDKVVEAVRAVGNRKFVGVVDAISTPGTYPHGLAILSKLGGGHLSCVHPPPAASEVPENVEAGMIFAVDNTTKAAWKNFVTPALASGVLKCLPPPTVVGKGLEHIQEALGKAKAGVSATKLVVEL
jgi:NADPH:quinone reductase-like Zn-dependent oxidoreductase